MSTPVLHLLAGPNGSGKTTFYEQVVAPATHLPFVNADHLAAERWPGEELALGHEASRLAAEVRQRFIAEGRSFVTETVFSHPSKVDLLRDARRAGYQVALHVILVPVELAVVRVALRVEAGGHGVPETKIRSRFERLWDLVAQAVGVADTARFYDNGNAEHPYRLVARYEHGRPAGATEWPPWTPPALGAPPGTDTRLLQTLI
ncbi:MAG TPA: zeta toxin family protein [Mycobacteriales bacterium]|nr:zeta toxin family protein [Mycobacteriales bacterium]